ncbi:uncharacterized protein FOMMEDRAFT_142801 [Fomitiporia mediterranea MF3/22]|uniref:uncharacterized protein n=1 Tax=Fomitiporia mediterranea (strain MF3/22) TaxID=694068 RepID=UPI00044098C6|nr:uncharacterized protein FOMMEDRAFT_142801 [Fomitiporia mediterranea MF3/22]EJC99169.1 hypothetical protein FOMMEDRAFT_142801 [Fomitiporia mediterranea MF3/22]
MNPDSAMDRTARWVQQHSQHSYRQQNATSRNHIKPLRPEGTSSQQSSRTDLGGQDRGVGSGGRAYAKQSSTIYAHAGSSYSNRQPPLVDEPLSSSHRRSRSHSASVPQDHRTPPRLNIPAALYRNPNLPAFVQGPPGSGYPMPMQSVRQPHPHPRAVVPSPPSPPLQVPAPLNPKKSRPTVHKRRPSLSGTTFEPPAYGSYPYREPDTREPRVQGQGDMYRARGRSASESRRR